MFRFGFIGVVLMVLALVHFLKYRGGNYIWLYVIIFLGPIGAVVYLIVEVLPELRSSHSSFKWLGRRKKIQQLEAVVIDNPSAGNYEELADLYLEEKKFTRARECYDRAVSSRTDSPDPFYRRAIAEIELEDFAAAIPDLERVVTKDPKYDFHRAARHLPD